jgi:trehalose-phosphatase
MPHGPPISVNIPAPLPRGLLAHLAAQHRIALFLDYDGTLSEITPDVANAAPVAGAPELISRLAARPERFVVAIISGRQTDEVIRLLGVSGDVTFVGNHGLEIIEPGGGRRMVVEPEAFMPDLERLRDWIRRNIPSSATGLLVEEKRFSVALHYRLADPALARDIRAAMSDFVRSRTPALRLGEGKMVIEALPRGAGKGNAVRMVLSGAGAGRLPVYFGDDITDEDAFYALREAGVTIRVGEPPAPGWAKYRVAAPRDVTAALTEMAAAPDPTDH